MATLSNKSVLLELIRRYGFHFSKGLGQNFLIDPEVPAQIAEQSGITKESFVLEIGPGIGTLTQHLCEQAGKVVAVELDDRLLPVLKETLSAYDNVEVVHGDILKLDLPRLLAEKGEGRELFVCANLPYYITTPIVMALLEQRLPFKRITVMVQKETAERLCAQPGDKECGAISAAVSYYSVANVLFDVPPEAFLPAPKVTSSVISLTLREKPAVTPNDEKLMFRLVKAAFGQRRKTLVNALKSAGIDKETAREAVLEICGDENIRGERLTLPQFAALADRLDAQKG